MARSLPPNPHGKPRRFTIVIAALCRLTPLLRFPAGEEVCRLKEVEGTLPIQISYIQQDDTRVVRCTHESCDRIEGFEITKASCSNTLRTAYSEASICTRFSLASFCSAGSYSFRYYCCTTEDVFDPPPETTIPDNTGLECYTAGFGVQCPYTQIRQNGTTFTGS